MRDLVSERESRPDVPCDKGCRGGQRGILWQRCCAKTAGDRKLIVTLPAMLYLLIPFALAAAVTLYVVHSSTVHGHLSADHDLSGPQKFHARPVPRIGGLGIFVGLAGMVALAWFLKHPQAKTGLLLLLAGLPAFGAGLIEDFTKKVSPRERLIATAVSAALTACSAGALSLAHAESPTRVARHSALLRPRIVASSGRMGLPTSRVSGTQGMRSRWPILILSGSFRISRFASKIFG